MEIERGPLGAGDGPGLGGFPPAGIVYEELDRVLVHDARIDALEPIIEPAKRFIGVLVQRPIEVDPRPDRQFSWTLPMLEGPYVARQVECISLPVSPEVGRQAKIGRKIHGPLPVIVVEQRVENDLADKGMAAVIRTQQGLPEARDGGNFRILQCSGDRLVVFPFPHNSLRRFLTRNSGP